MKKLIFLSAILLVLLAGCAQTSQTGGAGGTGGTGAATGGAGSPGTGSAGGGTQPATGGSGGAIISQEFPEPVTGIAQVAITNFAFEPPSITVKKGTVVNWTNYDAAPHALSGDDRTEISSGALAQNGHYYHQFNKPGTYPYHCSIHPSMAGTVIVE